MATRAPLGRPPVKGGSEPQASGGVGFFRDRLSDAQTNAFEIVHHFGVCEAHNLEIQTDEAQPGTVEIHDVPAQRLLAGELFGQLAQELVPELALGRRGIAAKRARCRFQAEVIRDDATVAHDLLNALRRFRLTKTKDQPPARLRLAAPLDRGAAGKALQGGCLPHG